MTNIAPEILRVLADGPMTGMTGMQVKEALDGPSTAQVFITIARLSRKDLVNGHVCRDDDGKERQYWRITPPGRDRCADTEVATDEALAT